MHHGEVAVRTHPRPMSRSSEIIGEKNHARMNRPNIPVAGLHDALARDVDGQRGLCRRPPAALPAGNKDPKVERRGRSMRKPALLDGAGDEGAFFEDLEVGLPDLI
jgi:hypothetical protein